MKQILMITLLIFSSTAWADSDEDLSNEPVLCEINYEYLPYPKGNIFVPINTRKGALEGIERCNKGDILTIGLSGYISERVSFLAAVCNLEKTITHDLEFKNSICEYTGRVLEIKRNISPLDKDDPKSATGTIYLGQN